MDEESYGDDPKSEGGQLTGSDKAETPATKLPTKKGSKSWAHQKAKNISDSNCPATSADELPFDNAIEKTP